MESSIKFYPSPPAGEGRSRKAAEGRGGTSPSRTELLARAKWMRANPTEAEKRLWTILRNKRLSDCKFKRQAIIDCYIVDFVNFEHRLIVEADGSQHADNRYDERRDEHLRQQGFNILRFWNNEALQDTKAVCEAIWHGVHPPLSLPPLRGSLLLPATGEGFERRMNA